MILRIPSLALAILFLLAAIRLPAEVFRVATYNVENYLDVPTYTRPEIKSAAARAKVRAGIRALNPDVIALEEMGSTNALLELRASLKTEGLDFPYWDHVSGYDTNIHVAILSKYPFITQHAYTNETFLLDGRSFNVSRGFAEVQIQPRPNFSFTLIAAHLKSRRPVPDADEAEERLGEARVLRTVIEGLLHADPDLNLIVLGDMNDVKDSDSTRALMGRGKYRLVDTRPAERNGDNTPGTSARMEPRDITWTDYFAKEDLYSRIDYILLSKAMATHWLPGESYVLALPNWGVGSDHRPITAGFDLGK
jgi:endonuclease/exonuclease/phosphatase family metal-dependent hydrolase